MRFLSGFFRYAGATLAGLGLAPVLMYLYVNQTGLVMMTLNWFQVVGMLVGGLALFVVGEVLRRLAKRQQAALVSFMGDR